MADPKRIYLSPPHMTGEEMAYVEEAFKTNWVAPLGPHVEAFEREVADKVGVKHALALSSGTAGIHLGLKFLGVGSGDLVLCSSLTFAATANPIVYLGATPVFIDSDPDTWNISIPALARAVSWCLSSGIRPKAVIAVDLYGQSADYDEILRICGKHGIYVLEDAAEALGANYKGRMCGSLGNLGVLSFNGNKIITTGGGGMLLSDDEEAIETARFWSTQARDKAPWYQHSQVGYNYRMSNVLAGIGRAQLKALDDRVAARRRVFERYRDGLSGLEGISFMPEAPYGRSNRWLTVILIDPSSGRTPLMVMDALAEKDIETRPLWKPMHLQPVFEGCRYFPHEDGFSVSDHLFQVGLCLPSGSSLTEEDQERVISAVKEIWMG
ncbi:putative PLP-dependent enzyme possibly involved in cell wall biogenesis [Thermanaerovibrio velox DSM 12556]|uniref:Putative PLP-dependent enzyme possibly involved in cell wall biogenesis n=1 Tax=Thermanaerovibrio velox DSM 12556 TaxID=926567 RepID=H0UMU7_9BACT|nr:DegT/DnrJ/EryC1/StrS family aminotransferase [Thermanaerovibrio velox]EHM09242.1 putative PLP-dependent enzyme possibly involved in cell wall biogenesis [Thermanaerovibrio velox DSM 12556]